MAKKTPEELIQGREQFAEQQDKIFQRELVEGIQQTAQDNKIRGALSLDADFNRAFSPDPRVDPFAINRSKAPIGPPFFLARRILHFVPPPAPNIPWKGVITQIEDYVPEVLNFEGGSDQNVVSPAFFILTEKHRKPDWLRIELEFPDKLVEFLIKHEFRAFLVPPAKLYPEVAKKAKLRESFAKYPVVPEDLLRGIRGMVVKSTDWNGPFGSPLKFAEHTLKHRNLVAAAFTDVFKDLGLELAPSAAVEVMFRDIVVDYKEMVVDIGLPGKPDTVAMRDLMVSPDDKEGFARLQEVEQTRTFYRRPVSYITVRFRAVWDSKAGQLVFLDKPRVVLPPSARE